jgi:hypothetical protein
MEILEADFISTCILLSRIDLQYIINCNDVYIFIILLQLLLSFSKRSLVFVFQVPVIFLFVWHYLKVV